MAENSAQSGHPKRKREIDRERERERETEREREEKNSCLVGFLTAQGNVVNCGIFFPLSRFRKKN
jgi:hypothetical protein